MLTGGVALGRVCSCRLQGRFLLLCNRLVLSDIKAIHCRMVTASVVGGWNWVGEGVGEGSDLGKGGISAWLRHCEILGSYLQQPNQHYCSRAYYKAEPHSQAEANRKQRIFSLISRSKLTNSVVTDNTSLACSIR